VLVTGSGSVWTNRTDLGVGFEGAGNQLTVANGGRVESEYGYLGFAASSSNNTVTVIGTDSIWNNHNNLYVGANGGGNQLTIAAGGTVLAGQIIVGLLPSSSNNTLEAYGGSLHVTNAAGNAVLDVRRGMLLLNSGAVTVDGLLATNGSSVVQFNGGVLSTRTTVVANASAFVVGNGLDSAMLNLLGGGHSFADGLTIASNATLAGSGTITAGVTIQSGGVVSPGNSIGTLTVAQLALLAGAILDFELGAPDGDNDFINVLGDLTLAGTLNVTGLFGFTNGTYTLMTYGGVLTDNGLKLGLIPDGFSGTIQAGSGEVNLVVVPEPNAATLVVLGVIAVALVRRRRTTSRN
jgi:T5SS/PEP-CTERM-associated repeat protein